MKQMLYNGNTVQVLRQGGKNSRIIVNGSEKLVPNTLLLEIQMSNSASDRSKKLAYAKKYGWHEVKFMQEMINDDTCPFKEVKNLIDGERWIEEQERRCS